MLLVPLVVLVLLDQIQILAHLLHQMVVVAEQVKTALLVQVAQAEVVHMLALLLEQHLWVVVKDLQAATEAQAQVH